MVTCAKQYVILKMIRYCHLEFTDSNNSSSAGSSLPQQTEMTGVMWVRIFNRLFMIIVGSASSNKLCCYQVQCLSCVAAAGHFCVQTAERQVCSHMSNAQTMSHPLCSLQKLKKTPHSLLDWRLIFTSTLAHQNHMIPTWGCAPLGGC